MYYCKCSSHFFKGCTYKSLSCSMNDHRRSHKFKVDKLVCHVCGMEFSSSTGLLVHSSYHKEADMKYKCRQCGKVFGWRHELNVSRWITDTCTCTFIFMYM